MKVLQVNVVYNTGSTGTIMYDIHSRLLKEGHDSVICYGRGAKTSDKGVVKTCHEPYAKFFNLFSRISGLPYGGLCLSTNRLIKQIKNEKPDVVHLHCLNGFFVNIYKLVKFLKNSGIPTVLTLHAEFMHTANCSYALDCDGFKTGCGRCKYLKRATSSLIFDRTAKSFKMMKSSFDGFEKLVVASVSPWLTERAKSSPILADKKHTVVLNGTNTEIFKPYETESLKQELGVSGFKTVFHATPCFTADKNHIKGGYYVLKMAEAFKDVKFVVAGPYEKDLKVPGNVILLGKVSDRKELARLYSMADVTLLTSKKETFSMIVAESLCCGTPVVGFEAGGPETITIDEFSSFVDCEDVAAMERALAEALEYDYDSSKIAAAANDKYSKDNMTSDYLELYEKIRE